MRYPFYIKKNYKTQMFSIPPSLLDFGRGWFTPFGLNYSCYGDYIFTTVLPDFSHCTSFN